MTTSKEQLDSIARGAKTLAQAGFDLDDLEPTFGTDAAVHAQMLDDGYDLPELAETMEEADARAAASTYLYALRRIDREGTANEREYRTLVAYYRDRHDARQKQLFQQQDYLRGALRKLFGFMRPSGKKKSLNLLGGRVGMRTKPDELVVENDDAVIAWAETRGAVGMTRTKTELNRKILREYMEGYREADDPTPPPGVTLEARPDEFYATPAKD